MPKTPNVMGFSGSVNGTTKNPGFLDFGFCQCKWAYSIYVLITFPFDMENLNSCKKVDKFHTATCKTLDIIHKYTGRAFTYVLGTVLAGTCSRNTPFLVV